MSLTAKELAEAISAQVIGNGDVRLHSVASLARATSTDLVFCETPALLEGALASAAGSVIVGQFAAQAATRKALLIAEQPRLAFALAAKALRVQPRSDDSIHPSAVVSTSAILGHGVIVGPSAVIDDEARVGDNVSIGAGAVVGKGVVVGDGCVIHPRVAIYPGTTLGRSVVVHAGAVLGSDGFGYVRDRHTGRYHQMPQIGTLRIGDFVEIGANATIDRGALEETVIGEGTKLDNLVHVGHNVTLGANIVIAAQTGISGSSSIGDNAVIGGQVGIGDHARIEGGVILGSKSGILTRKVLRGQGQVFWGVPAKPLQQHLKELAALARLTKRR